MFAAVRRRPRAAPRFPDRRAFSQVPAKRRTIVGLVAVGCLTATILPALISAASAVFRRLWSTNCVRRVTSALVSPASPAFPMIVSMQVSSGSCDIGEPENISSADITAGSAAPPSSGQTSGSYRPPGSWSGGGGGAVRSGTTAPLQPSRVDAVREGRVRLRSDWAGNVSRCLRNPARPLRARKP